MNNKKELEKNTGVKKFDICLMNPPYDRGLGEKFFTNVLKIADKVVTVQPTTWLFGKKQNKRVIEQLNDCKCDITIINPEEFDAGFLSKVSINFIDKTKEKEILLYNELTDKLYTYKNIEDVTELSLDELLSKFNNIVKHLYEKDCFAQHAKATWKEDMSKTIEDDLPMVRFVGIRGNKMTSNSSTKGLSKAIEDDLPMVRFVNSNNAPNKDFYTIFSNNKKEQQEKVLISGKDLLDKTKKIPFVFVLNNKKEQIALFNYMQTDFCRACLATIKNNQHLDTGELKNIPWFDFSQDIFSKSPREIDDYLFKKYNISDEIRKHIEDILPDYYNIRK